MNDETYTFTNCEGETISFKGHDTLDDMLKAGVFKISMTPITDPPSTDPIIYVDTRANGDVK